MPITPGPRDAIIPGMKQVVVTTAQGNSRLVWVELFVLLNVWDALTTWAGISSGIPEGNPIPALLIESGGIGALVLAKMALVALLGGAVLSLPRYRRLMYALYVGSALLAVAVLSNLSLILA